MKLKKGEILVEKFFTELTKLKACKKLSEILDISLKEAKVILDEEKMVITYEQSEKLYKSGFTFIKAISYDEYKYNLDNRENEKIKKEKLQKAIEWKDSLSEKEKEYLYLLLQDVRSYMIPVAKN